MIFSKKTNTRQEASRAGKTPFQANKKNSSTPPRALSSKSYGATTKLIFVPSKIVLRKGLKTGFSCRREHFKAHF